MRAWVDGVVLEGGRAGEGPAVDAVPHEGAGDSVFTTVLVCDGRALAWRRHLRRLAGSAAELVLGELDIDLVERAAREVCVAGLPERARLRVLWGRSSSGGTHLALRLTALAPPGAAARVMTPTVMRTAGSLLSAHKSSHYAENLLAAAEARRVGADEALLATQDGMLSEGTGSNVFYVVGGELRTPPLTTGCLPGVARELVLEWVGAREVEEPVHRAQQADEVLLTSSTREVQPVESWSGRSYAVPGPVTRTVLDRWQAGLVDPAEWFALV